jgi:hypothetical protein
MTIDLALEYIPKRMLELGYGRKDYSLRFRHFVFKASEQIRIDAFNQLYILVEEAEDIAISSELGLFDLSSLTTNEMQYEHQGQIKISNQSVQVRHVRFIQIIFKTNKRCQIQPQHTTSQKWNG